MLILRNKMSSSSSSSSSSSRYKVLLESYQKAYPEVLKQNQFKAAQREWNCVKNVHENHEKFLLTL